MIDYQIREVQINDVQDIYHLNTQEMGYDYPLTQTKLKLQAIINSPHDKIYVAIKDHQVIGYVHANDYDTIYAPHMKNIMGIAVDSRYKRQGIGTALLTKIEQWAKESGAKGVRLVSGATRKNAHAFYRSMGYGHEKQQINFKKMFDEVTDE